ncbi:metal-dependent hydrolase [Microbacterium sp. ASV49]|uniref:Metal-dependent hydrolase n=1 Tax=Microbacterium candidum TaxID=3041922 RepID=A0ABT7MYV8_9MICO|nr:metal-dependent hydrolase [Microbacterium sp. ASV49]MDL9979621.1 metal-dependent hydrolase [Microbacterium sp. ASV49]
MMGGHHAATGAAAWVAVTATAPGLAALHVLPLAPGETALGAVLCAGAALLPDADHRQATAARSAGPISEAAASLVSTISGGHRHGTHSPLAAAVVIALAWAAWHLSWITTDRYSISWWVCGATIAVLAAFALRVLKIVSSWTLAWLAGVGAAAAICLLWPSFLPLLPAIVVIGIVVHLAGDFLTTGGLPVFWPLKVPGPPLVPHWLWSRGGYIALPVLGDAGSWREWLLLVPISLYALWGVGASLLLLITR